MVQVLIVNTRLLVLSLTASFFAYGQTQPLLGEDTTKVSEHVWAIMGWPNVGIVVGSRAVLVVDTGLGPRNGATVARVAKKLAPGREKLFLATTHFHPEHAGGSAGFPPGTILVRNAAQQREMDSHGKEMIELFSGRSPQFKELLSDAVLTQPDIVYDKEATLDLGGGVAVRLLWFGGAHTKGDQLIFVEPDRTLISGDVVQNKVVPGIFRDGGTPSSWVAVLDKIAALNAEHVLPTHSPAGTGALVGAEKQFITDLKRSALELKSKGVSADDAGKQLTESFKAKYTDWPSMNVAGFVKNIYTE